MATSSSYDFTVSAEDIIQSALLKVGGVQEGEAVPAEQTTTALRSLNMLIKYISAKGGRHLWKREEVVLFLTANTPKYLLGPAATDAEWCLEEDFVETTMSAAHISGTTSLSVASTTGMTASDRIGIRLSDGTRSWSTITSVDSSTTLTIPALAGAASSGDTVYTYTTRPQRPLHILHARRQGGPSDEDVPIEIEAQEMYRDQPLKTGSGTPTFVSYKPTLTSGELHIWQPPSDIDMRVKMTVTYPFEDIDAAANNLDFPAEWYHPLTLILASTLEPEYRQLDPTRLQMLKADSQEAWSWVMQHDDDDGSIIIEPGYGS